MRYFWSLIVLLALVTAGLYTLRVRADQADLTPVGARAPQPGTPSTTFGRPSPTPETPPQTRTDPVPPPAVPVEAAAETVPVVEPAPMAEREPLTPEAPKQVEGSEPALAEAAEAGPTSNFSLDSLLGLVSDAADETAQTEQRAAEATTVSAPASASTPEPGSDGMFEAAAAAARANEAAEADAQTASAPAQAGPAFEVRADGSLSVEGVGVITGNGTAQRPFVLDWQVLRSIQRDYNPRQGQSEIPAWLNQLHGKHVRVEGNTLLPVVAQTTDELLVMQNPWDGCCLGVPPTPYDAIEVKLARPQRMGNSPTGFGQVEGVFKVDAYIVSGWLLGLYVIDDAVFESAAGIVLPEL